jgi:hypothetical protein
MSERTAAPSRSAYAHEALLEMAADGDTAAPGAAVTVELCGHWEHEPPCPLAPHSTTAERVQGALRVRVVFATQPDDEPEVRRRIERALERGRLEGVSARWRLLSSGPSAVADGERERAARLAADVR